MVIEESENGIYKDDHDDQDDRDEEGPASKSMQVGVAEGGAFQGEHHFAVP